MIVCDGCGMVAVFPAYTLKTTETVFVTKDFCAPCKDSFERAIAGAITSWCDPEECKKRGMAKPLPPAPPEKHPAFAHHEPPKHEPPKHEPPKGHGHK